MTAKSAAKFVEKAAPARVAEEFGRTCTNLGILIAMATIIGEGMLRSGAAEAIAAAMLRVFGAARAHWAFFASSFLLCIPVMLDTVMYLRAASSRRFARKTAATTCCCDGTVAGGTITHCSSRPRQVRSSVAGDLGVPLGLMIGMGSAHRARRGAVGVALRAGRAGGIRSKSPLRSRGAEIGRQHPLPALWLALLPSSCPSRLSASMPRFPMR